MRVIVLNDYGYVNGGAAQVAVSSLNDLAQSGLDVTFIFGVGPVDPRVDSNLVRVVDLGLHDLLGNPSRIRAAVSGIWERRTEKRLREVLSDFRPGETVLHLHSWIQSLSSSAVRTAVDMGFPVVCTLHDYFAVCPNGGLYNFSQQRSCELRPMTAACITCNCDSRNYAHKLWRVGRHAVQETLGQIPEGITSFISVSAYSESIIRPLLLPTARFYRVCNPIDIAREPPATVVEQNAFTFIGRLSPEKGASSFAAAAQLAGVRARFIGSGAEQSRIARIYPATEFTGWLDRLAVVHAIRSSRCIVFPSLWHEPQGMVVWEAAALGVPAIVADSCAAGEAIVDGETGLLFKSGDVSDLASRLTLLDRNPSLAAQLGQKAYDHYWAAPSTQASHTKQLITVYSDILNLPRS
jgi:glycosyltransferase involved in cell wall biosynthesis